AGAASGGENGAHFPVGLANELGSVTSSIATLTVNSPPTITSQPASRTVTAGQAATFSVTATGTAPLGYQWQRDGAPISGATGASYTTPATTSADNGAQFRVVVSNSVSSATSNAATLTVNVPRFTLTVTKQNILLGSGTVTGPGISCGADCSETYDSGTKVTLTATPSFGVFAGWSGACSGILVNICTVTMTQDRSVT